MSSVILLEDSSKSLFGGGQKISSFAIVQLSRHGKRVVYIDFVVNHKLKVYLSQKSDEFLKLFHSHSGKLIGRLLNLALVLPNFIKLFLIILREKQPIIYATTKRALIYGGTLGLVLRVPYVYHAHMVMQGKPYDKAILFLIKHAHKCICVSDYTLSDYQKRGIKNLFLLENPLEGGVVREHKPRDSRVFSVAFIGSLVEIKGVKYLLEIFNNHSSQDIEIHVFGTGVQMNYFKECYGSNQHIQFHGFVDDVNKYLDELIDVLVLPTLIPESASTVIQQAMSRGVPVITTNIGAQKTFVIDGFTGFLVKPQSSDDIMKAILKMKQNPELYETLSKNCRETAKKFISLEVFGKELNELFDRVNTK